MACSQKDTITPAVIDNRPALSKIKYRVGHYASFRQAMLEAISGYERWTDDSTAPANLPLRKWTIPASADVDVADFGIALLEMWAYLGDILTFYQERIANEAFLRTAVHFESAAHLVSLIGYRPAPGRAAAADLEFEVEDGAPINLAAGLLVQSVPGQDEKPQKFETIEGLTAYASLNKIRPRTREPQRLIRGATQVVLAGVGHALNIGDWFAIAGDNLRRNPGSEHWDVRQILSVNEDSKTNTTTVTWEKGLGREAPNNQIPIGPDPHPEFWVFRSRAWMFGHNAPDYNLFTVANPEAVNEAFKAAFPDWNDKYLPEDTDHPEHIYLDTVYPGINPGGWTALVTKTIDPAKHTDLSGYDHPIKLYAILDVAETSLTNYTLSGKATRLTVASIDNGQDNPKPRHIDYFPIKGTAALVQSEQIALASVPIGHSSRGGDENIPRPISGISIDLAAEYPDLHRGRKLLVTGMVLDSSGNPVEADSETVRVSSVEHDETDKKAVIFLAAPLKNSYDRTSVRIFGNVAQATHGETVSDEAIGDGDASLAFQSFSLQKAPLTYVAQAGAPGGAASTLEIRVDGIRWDEAAELYGQAGDARIYTVRRDPDGTLNVHFGDGQTGARLVSGRSNVRASYRLGLGPDGDVAAESLRTLLQKPLGLNAVRNPIAAAGGAAAENTAAVKQNAPGTVRTFGRIVSLRDFEDAARETIGIAKARATWIWDGEGRIVQLVVAGDRGAAVEPVMGDLQADLDARRDPHQPMRIRDFKRMPVSVAVQIVVDDAFILATVQLAAQNALAALFAFDNLDLGQTVHLSDVHKAVQQADGVVAVDVEIFRFKYPADRVDRGGDALVQPRLLVAAGEMAWVEAPDDLRVAGARFQKGGAS